MIRNQTIALHVRQGWCVLACALTLSVAIIACTREAAAQTAARKADASKVLPPAGLFEISGGVGVLGRTDLGTATATLSGSGVPQGSPITLFDTATQIDGGERYEARVAWRLGRARILQVEGGVAINRTHLTTRITNDFEQAPNTEARETFTEYAIEAGLLFQLRGLTFAGGRARPFVTGGAGYLRQVHEGQTLIETGQSAYAGGGLMFTLRQAARPAFIETLGLRTDVRANIRSGGFEHSDDNGATTFAPSVTGGLFIRF